MGSYHKLTPRILVCTLTTLLVGGSTLAATATSQCINISGCERKICEKQKELDKAKEYNDIAKIIGLQNSIVHLQESCALDPNHADKKYAGKMEELKEEYKQDLEDALEEYQDDLAEAKSEGKENKILLAKEKYEAKLSRLEDEYNAKVQQLKDKF